MKTKIKHNNSVLIAVAGAATLAFLLIVINLAGAATTIGTNFSTDGNLTVNGNTALGDTTSDTTTVQGQTTITTLAAGLLNVLTGNLKVGNGTPAVTLDGEDAYVEGTLEVDGASQFDGAVTANGNVTIGNETTDTASVAGDITITGTSTVNGNAVLGNATTDTVSIAGDLTTTGTTTVNGNTALGNASTDLITLTAVLNSGVTFLKEVARTIQIANTTSSEADGADLTIQGAAGMDTARGGHLNITAGAGGTAAGGGTGGQVNITSGAGGGSGALGGTITLKIGAGASSSVGANTGRVVIATASAAAASHLASTQTTAPVVTMASGGSSISCTRCTDMKGIINVTTDGNDNQDLVLTFNKTYTTAPICFINPANVATGTQFHADSKSLNVTTTITAMTIDTNGLWPAAALVFNYFCIE